MNTEANAIAILKDLESELKSKLLSVRYAIKVMTGNMKTDPESEIKPDPEPIKSANVDEPAKEIQPDTESEAKGTQGVCITCTKIFTRIRKGQKCCSSVCRSQYFLKKNRDEKQNAKLDKIRQETPIKRGRPKVDRGVGNV